jgi:hypothetical protein
MRRRNRTPRALALAAAVACGAGAAAQVRGPDRGPMALVERADDTAWLEHIAASDTFAREVQGRSPVGMPKALRVAAFARLGAIGSADALAAIARIEHSLAERPLTPATEPLDAWPTVAWHVADAGMEQPMAAAPRRDGVTYAVVAASLLGGTDLFLVATRTPADRASWSRPKLVGPLAGAIEIDRGTLAWRGPRTLVFTADRDVVQIAIDDVERDSDADGWTDLEEARIGSNPHSADTDGDGIPDGRDVCPLYAKPPGADEASQVLQTAIFGAFAMTGSRQLLYATPQTPRVHLSGYGGPIIYDRAIPKSGDGNGAVYVSWKIMSRTENDAVVELTDWEGMLAAGGQDVTLKRTAGRWVVVAVRSTWVS